MTPIGTITIPAATSVNNKTTAVPFSVYGLAAIEVLTSASDVLIALTDNDGASPTIDASDGQPLTAGIALSIPIAAPQGSKICKSATLACYSTGGATVAVKALWPDAAYRIPRRSRRWRQARFDDGPHRWPGAHV